MNIPKVLFQMLWVTFNTLDYLSSPI